MPDKSQIDNLYYNVGKQYNFELAYAEQKGDEVIWSKWKKYLEVQANTKFMEKANNRTILPIEIVLDIEDPKRFKEIFDKVKQKFEFYSAYKTGSKGYHIHLFFKEELNSEDKIEIIKRYGCDEQKASNRCMIALENRPHWKTGKNKELIEEKIGYNQKPKSEKKVDLLLDGDGRNMSDLAKDTAEIIKDKKVLFYRPNSRQIVEVGKIKLQNTNEDLYTGFRIMRDKRFITMIEKYADVGFWGISKFGEGFEFKSLSTIKADIILNSEILEQSLPQIERIFPIPIPIMYKEELTFARKGFDERFNSWLPYDAPEITEDMDLVKAKEIIEQILSEFCFKSPQDKTNAIAGLLTPFLRGLYESFNTRTPVFFYRGNRERVGKDYCAGITGIVYDGQAIEDNPVSSGEGRGNNNEELRKKITSALISGRKRIHFANNKGFINNAILEQVSTSKFWSDRLLGRNETITLPNEMDFSLSGNVGVSYTPDFANRCRFVNLFYDKEDANARTFNNPLLHEWVIKNRGIILSALFSFVKNWIKRGKPDGSLPFSSFSNWADVCGGIMECAGYESPCSPDEDVISLGGDSETSDMKQLYEIGFQAYPNTPIKKNKIFDMIKEDEGIFGYYDLTLPKDKSKFMVKFRRFIGRELSGIKLLVTDDTARTPRQEFIFKKEVNDGLVGSDGSDW